MGSLRELFGPSHKEVWAELAQQIDAQFHDGSWFGVSNVQSEVKDWIITLDTYTVSTGKSSVTYTRMRAPFVNPDGFRFHIFRTGFFNELGRRWFKTMDLEVGDPDFDRAFTVRVVDDTAANHSVIRTLLADPGTRALMLAQPSFSLQAIDNEAWPNAQFPAGVDELVFQVVGVIKDRERLKALFDLFADLLGRLCHASSAYEDSADVFLQELAAPGGTVVRSGVLMWDGNAPRRRAAKGLGRLKEPRAVGPLLGVLSDEDDELRQRAIVALGEIGDRRAVPFLISRLRDSNQLVQQAAKNALQKLGEEKLVATLEAALRGDPTSLLELKQFPHRKPIIQALIHTVEDGGPFLAWAAQALAALGAIEALPLLEQRKHRVSLSDELKELWESSIQKLTAFAALPRTAGAPPIETDTLPRPADGSVPSTDTLPKPADG